MNKKILTVLVLVLGVGIIYLGFNLITGGGSNIPLTEEDCFEINEEGKITAYKEMCDVEVNIPEKIKGIKVKAIGSFVFARKEITKLVLPEGLEEIGIGAFEENLIEKVEIPSTVKTIKTLAFNNNKISKLKLGDNVTEIGNAAFNNNELKDSEAFIYMRSEKGIDETIVVSYAGKERKKVKVPSNVTMLYLKSFANCNIEEIILSENLERIEANALEGNKLTSIAIPNSVIVINEGALSDNDLKEIIIFGKKSLDEFGNFDLTNIDEKIIKFEK